MSKRVVHFEIHAAEPERAIAFYQAVFGWEFHLWLEEPKYWGVMTAPEGSSEAGINGGLFQRQADNPVDGAAVNAFVCTVIVEDFDAIHEAIMEAGGTVARPKQAITGLAWQGYYKDTEGNIFGIHQRDENAK